MNEKQKVVDWLKWLYKGEFSELGANVALFLDEMFGLHHLSTTSLKKVDWSNDTFIEIVYDQTMATVDNDDLTRLVVLAHQTMLRVDLRGAGPGYVKMMFHQRTTRNRGDGIYKWCPTIEEHVAMIAKYHPHLNAAQQAVAGDAKSEVVNLETGA